MLRKSLTCISLLFVGCGISYFGIDYHEKLEDTSTNELLIGHYFKREEQVKDEFIAILEMPKLKFKRGLYAIENPNNMIDKNIAFLDKSDMPSDDNSRVIIAGHSGNRSNSYFKNLYKLKNKDKIYLYYNNIKYIYEVTDRYDIIKNGTMALEPNHNKKTLTLVTCKSSNKQLVIISTLKKQEAY